MVNLYKVKQEIDEKLKLEWGVGCVDVVLPDCVYEECGSIILAQYNPYEFNSQMT